MSDELMTRLERLEKSNRMLKQGFCTLVVLCFSLCVIAAKTPARTTVSAERFVLTDSGGRERAELSEKDGASALQFLNPNGTQSLVLASSSVGSGFFLSDLKGKHRAALLTSDDGSAVFSLIKADSSGDAVLLRDTPEATILSFKDSKGIDRIDLGYHEKGAGLVVADASGVTRTNLAEGGLITYDKAGLIEWSSLGQNLSPSERKHVIDLLNRETSSHVH